jgi:hypothetical protein
MKRLKDRRLNCLYLNRNRKLSRNVIIIIDHLYIILEAETKRLEAKIQAESEAEVNKIEMDK